MAHWTLPRSLCVVAMLVMGALGDDVLRTIGFTDCGSDDTITVSNLAISYDNDNRLVTFDVSGTSTVQRNVTATLSVTAYGNSIFSQSFNPCDDATYVAKLCPVPSGPFTARGTQEISKHFASMIPSIAFDVPDIAAQATLELDTIDTGKMVACIQSEVTNGKSFDQPVVSYIAAGVAGAALVVSGISAAAGAASGGGSALGVGSMSPGFTEVAGWFQGMALNGMLSVSYPPIYRNFAKNFAFSTGLVPWDDLLKSIDGFRARTGGNLTNDSVEYLRNATLVFPDGSIDTPESSHSKLKRALNALALMAREVTVSANETASDGAPATDLKQTLSGIQAFAAELAVPKSDIFMTALLIVAIVIGVIVVGILLVKVVLEVWALFGSFPQSLTGFRKHYWNSIARTITSLVLLLYGVWVLYCVYQFTLGDSWAAKALAAVSLGLFTGLLAFFSFMIWNTARKLKAEDGDVRRLFEDKSIWVKYSMFYESYNKGCWWIFMPTIVYLLVKGCILAVGDGHGMVQSVAMLVLETLMLALLIWSRPYERRSSNILNIAIQAVRFLSIACILVFVEEFGIAKTTQTVTGVVLIAIQSALTVSLSVLVAWNAINALRKMNPHRQRRKQMEKIRDLDDLTPLDARNSLLFASSNYAKKDLEASMYPVPEHSTDKLPLDAERADRYYQMPDEGGAQQQQHDRRGSAFRSLTPGMQRGFVPTGRDSHQMMQQEPGQLPSYEFNNAGYRGF